MNKHFATRLGLSLSLFGVLWAVSASGEDESAFRRARLEMVQKVLEAEGIENEKVLEAMRKTPRHLFVPRDLQSQAYFDQALPIGHKQTISPPFIVAYMTQVIDPQQSDRVLEIGTGSGYQAAVLSGIVKEVYTVEIVEPLGLEAAERLRSLGYRNVQVKVGDGYQGWAEHAPFDKIIVTCSPEDVPQPLVEQLKEGGKMIIPLGERYQQVFYLFEKRDGKLVKTELIPTLFVPMTGMSEEERKIRPDPTRPEIKNGSFESAERDEERPDGWHYQRQLEIVRGNAPEGEVFATFSNVTPGRHAQALQGMAVDGRKVGALRVGLWVKGSRLRAGSETWEQPALVVHYFDGDRNRVGEAYLGPWNGSFHWKQAAAELPVPHTAREAIVQVGLNGATGTLSVDGIRLTGRGRR